MAGRSGAMVGAGSGSGGGSVGMTGGGVCGWAAACGALGVSAAEVASRVGRGAKTHHVKSAMASSARSKDQERLFMTARHRSSHEAEVRRGEAAQVGKDLSHVARVHAEPFGKRGGELVHSRRWNPAAGAGVVRAVDG